MGHSVLSPPPWGDGCPTPPPTPCVTLGNSLPLPRASVSSSSQEGDWEALGYYGDKGLVGRQLQPAVAGSPVSDGSRFCWVLGPAVPARCTQAVRPLDPPDLDWIRPRNLKLRFVHFDSELFEARTVSLCVCATPGALIMADAPKTPLLIKHLQPSSPQCQVLHLACRSKLAWALSSPTWLVPGGSRRAWIFKATGIEFKTKYVISLGRG